MIYGPWQAQGISEGTAEGNFRYWYVEPLETIPAGEYKVVDSDPATWSHNSTSGSRGFTLIAGELVIMR